MRLWTLLIPAVLFLFLATFSARVFRAVTPFGRPHFGIYRHVDLKRLGDFPFDPRRGQWNNIPAEFRALDGKKVRLIGEMYQPWFEGNKVTSFTLLHDLRWNSRIQGPPQIQRFVMAKVRPDASVQYYGKTVIVTGTLHVEITRDENRVSGVYYMDVEKVILK